MSYRDYKDCYDNCDQYCQDIEECPGLEDMQLEIDDLKAENKEIEFYKSRLDRLRKAYKKLAKGTSYIVLLADFSHRLILKDIMEDYSDDPYK
jgi:hypothetical protein